MKIEKVESGIHTIQLYALKLTYSQVQKSIDTLADIAPLKIIWEDHYSIDRRIASSALNPSGIRLFLQQTHDISNSIGIIVNPNILLDRGCPPTQLFHPRKSACRQLLDQMEDVLHRLNLEDNPFQRNLVVSPQDLSLSQMDLTINIWFEDDTDLVEIIRLFSKGKVPNSFKRKDYGTPEETSHCFTANSHTVTLKAYDKVYDLNRFGRCPPELRGQKILRVEVSLKRDAFLQKLHLDREDDLHTMLKTGYQSVRPILQKYLKRLFPCSGPHRTFAETLDRIQSSDLKKKKKEQMEFLVLKTSDGDGLDTALEKLKKKYGIKDQRTIRKLYDSFEELDINPITLRNDSAYQEVPNPRKMIEKSI